MANPSKARGTKWESDCVNMIKTVDPWSERAPPQGAIDKGDILLDQLRKRRLVIIECKAGKDFKLAEWQKETERERQLAGTTYGLLWIKAPRKRPEEGYCVTPIWQALAMLRSLLELEKSKERIIELEEELEELKS